MPYITIPITPKAKQLSFDDILNGVTASNLETRNTFDTKTVYRKETPQKLLDALKIQEMIESLTRFTEAHKSLISLRDKSSLYESFMIPKKSGGLRQIDAPKEELMRAFRELKFIFEKKLYASYHTSAFAYVRGRCTLNAVQRHQGNKSRWFLKIDFHNFFGSTTKEFLYSQITMSYPFNEIVKRPEGEKALKDVLSMCMLHDGLPQGTPMSPMLTNLMMIPIDHALAKCMRERTPHLVYTRYADDMLLSSDISFRFTDVLNEISEVLKKFNAPFSINKEKTRYGSSNGSNWNLGVMLNKDNEITIGYQKKKYFKAILFSLHSDYKNKRLWSVDDAQKLLGQISYYRSIEKDKIDEIIMSYDKKFNVSTIQILKTIIRRKVS